jgi:hypothetical protein
MQDETNSQAVAEPITQADEVAETTPDQGSTQAQPQTEAKPLTAEDFRQIAREEAMRVAQSQTAKSENRINQRIAERFAALDTNKGVLNLTDDQVKQAQKAIIEDEQMNAFAKPTPQAQSGQAQPPSTEPFDPGQFIETLKTNAFKLAGGTEVTPNDKEWAGMQAILDDPNGNPDLFVLASIDASRAKAQRLQAQQKKAPGRLAGAAGAATAVQGYDPTKPASFYLEQAAKKDQ